MLYFNCNKFLFQLKETYMLSKRTSLMMLAFGLITTLSMQLAAIQVYIEDRRSSTVIPKNESLDADLSASGVNFHQGAHGSAIKAAVAKKFNVGADQFALVEKY